MFLKTNNFLNTFNLYNNKAAQQKSQEPPTIKNN
jgi:hypothetical protein